MGKYKIYKGKKPNGEWKIGNTEHYPQRCKVQKLSDYYILEEHDDKKIASIRELELQREHGVEVDDVPYHTFVNGTNQSKGGKTQPIEAKRKGGLKNSTEHLSNAGKIGGKGRAKQITFEELSYAGKQNRTLEDYQVIWLREQYKRGTDSFGNRITIKRLRNVIPLAYGAMWKLLNNVSYKDI